MVVSQGNLINLKNIYTMRELIIKSISAVLAIIALVMLVGDLPDASLIVFSIAKFAGFTLLLAAVRIWNKYIPEEEV